MTYALIGDPHVGNFTRYGGMKRLGMNRRCELTLEALNRALLCAVEQRAHAAIILGDLFDSMRPEPQLIDAVRQLFRAFGKLEIFLLKGNHDSASDEPRDTALWAVDEPNVRVFDEPAVVHASRNSEPSLVMVPFRSGNVIDWLPDLLAGLSVPPGAIMCLHAGIKDEETAPWLLGAPDAIEMRELDKLMDRFQIDLVFAGNWHEHQVWDRQGIFQVGALSPTGFSNLGGSDLYGHVKVVRTPAAVTAQATITDHSIPGPRFYKVGPTESPRDFLKEGSGEHVYIEWTAPAATFAEARAELEGLIASGQVEAGSVLPDTSGAAAGLKRAASAAKSSIGISEAVAAFVGKLQLPPLADRHSIHARIRAYTGLE